LRLNKIKNILIIRPNPVNVTANIADLCEGIEPRFREVGVIPTVVKHTYLSVLNNETIEEIQGLADIAIEKEFDSVMVCASSEHSSEVVATRFKEKNWTPKIAISTCDNPWITENSHYWLIIDSVRILLEIQFALSLSFVPPITTPPPQYSDSAQYPTDQYFGNAATFRALDRSTTSSTVTVSNSLSLWAAHAMLMVYNAIKTTKSTDQERVADAIRRGVTDTFLGTFAFDADNSQTFAGSLRQIVNYSIPVISPLVLQEIDLIFPMPKWDERVNVPHWDGVEYAALVVLSLAVANTIFWFVWTIVNRRNQTVTASAPTFLALMLVGSLFIYISLFLSVPYYLTSAMCGARVWLLTIGTTLLMGSMLAKTWFAFLALPHLL